MWKLVGRVKRTVPGFLVRCGWNELTSTGVSIHPFIAFEGPIASGKTTHATLLAERLESKLLLEHFPKNEFLADFYGDNERWALPMQLSFLALRSSQLRTVVAPLDALVIADYSHLKDPAFAELLLTSRELRLYQQIYGGLAVKIVPHHLVVYLDARNDVLLDRIRRRGRSYESAIDSSYQDNLRDAYEKAFRANSQLKVVRYDTSDLDLNSVAAVRRLQETILSSLPSMSFPSSCS
jgi:deoxyguanosine kinase